MQLYLFAQEIQSDAQGDESASERQLSSLHMDENILSSLNLYPHKTLNNLIDKSYKKLLTICPDSFFFLISTVVD